jgi:putative transcriptional regulator
VEVPPGRQLPAGTPGKMMTQEELAQRVGVTRQTIIALEARKYVPSLLLAFKLASTFGVKVEDVFQYSGSRLPPRHPS